MENIIINWGKDKNETLTTNEILNQLENACYNHGLDGLNGLHECKSGQFGNILSDIGHGYIKPMGLFILDRKYTGKNNIEYDRNILNILLELYIYLCTEYDKAIYVTDYYNFCGVNQRFFNESSVTDNETLKSFMNYARKRIDDADNERMGKRASDSKQALLNMGYVNYRHNWNGQIKKNEIETTAKSLSEIRQLYITGDNKPE